MKKETIELFEQGFELFKKALRIEAMEGINDNDNLNLNDNDNENENEDEKQVAAGDRDENRKKRGTRSKEAAPTPATFPGFGRW